MKGKQSNKIESLKGSVMQNNLKNITERVKKASISYFIEKNNLIKTTFNRLEELAKSGQRNQKSHFFNTLKGEIMKNKYLNQIKILKGTLIKHDIKSIAQRIKKSSFLSFIEKSNCFKKIYKRLEQLARNKQKINKIFEEVSKHQCFKNWKAETSKDKYQKTLKFVKGNLIIKNLASIVDRIKRSSISNIAHKSSQIKDILAKLEKFSINHKRRALNEWSSNILKKKAKSFSIHKGINILKKLCRNSCKSLFDHLLTKAKMLRISNKIVKNQMENQRLAFNILSERVRKMKLI